MKKTTIILLVLSLFASKSFFAQNSDILLTIDNHKITKSEFERIYHKNNSQSTVDKKSIEEYLDLFINFKLKVYEAERLGYDTVPAFKTELAKYVKQLAKPYLVDKSVDEYLMKEAYEHMKEDVNASHILIELSPEASPEDTLKVYNKILSIRKRVVAGEKFEDLAKKYSTDPSAKSNNGLLGWFTAFQMVYDFEKAAFNTKVGSVSMPFRTRFGYHIVKINDKREARGEIKVAHIMVAIPKNSTPTKEKFAKTEIDSIYKIAIGGKDFAELAKELSDDKGSAKKGGELPWFGTGRMVPEFETAAFNLKNTGVICKPIRTSAGWHIIKFLEKKATPKYDDVKNDIKNKISKDARASKSRNAIIEKLKKEYNYELVYKTKKHKKSNINEFKNLVTDSLFVGKWKMPTDKTVNNVLFTLGDSSYTGKSFAKYLLKFNRKSRKEDISILIDKKFEKFTGNKVIEYEEARLSDKYPEYKYLTTEYHDGILLFELTDKMVWSKAVSDTLGLEAFYERTKNNYMWDTRYDTKILECKTEKITKKTNKLLLKGTSVEDVITELNKKDTSSIKLLEEGIFLKGDNNEVDKIIGELKDKKETVKLVSKTKLIKVKVIAPEPKKLNEAKGLITADYQTQLEKIWIKQLREKSHISINKEVLTTVK